ncbi:MAG: VTT domain-containing protein [Myxococcota bacterium]|nr:VTT domain-containing protein [Myxococcota bacterium]
MARRLSAKTKLFSTKTSSLTIDAQDCTVDTNLMPGTSEKTEPTSASIEGELGLKRIDRKSMALKLLVGFAFVFILATISGIWLKEPIEAIGTSAVEKFGVPGLYLFVLAIDSFPTPFSYAPIMLLAIEGGISTLQVFIVSSLASMSGGLIGYVIGRVIGLPPRLADWLITKHPENFRLLRKYGAQGVALIGALPLPFALGTWTAGAMRVNFGGVALALLIRIPKTAFYILLITAGLSLGNSS